MKNYRITEDKFSPLLVRIANVYGLKTVKQMHNFFATTKMTHKISIGNKPYRMWSLAKRFKAECKLLS